MILAAAETAKTASLLDSAAVAALIGLVATVAVAVLGHIFGRWSASAERRRAGYAEATSVLVAWAEYPYRIRRRTSDEGETLTALAHLGHDLQEELRYRQTWIMSDSRHLAELFSDVRKSISQLTGPACTEAWDSGPVTEAKGMHLHGWGPGAAVDPHLRRFERAVACRFGWRRSTPAAWWIRPARSLDADGKAGRPESSTRAEATNASL